MQTYVSWNLYDGRESYLISAIVLNCWRSVAGLSLSTVKLEVISRFRDLWRNFKKLNLSERCFQQRSIQIQKSRDHILLSSRQQAKPRNTTPLPFYF